MSHQQAPFARAAPVALRYATLAGFGPGQASPQHAPLDGASLVASAREEHLQAPFVGAALVALRYAALAGFGPDQAPPRQPPLDGGALEHQETQDWAPLVALAGTGHQQTQDWAALVTPDPLGYLASGW